MPLISSVTNAHTVVNPAEAATARRGILRRDLRRLAQLEADEVAYWGRGAAQRLLIWARAQEAQLTDTNTTWRVVERVIGGWRAIDIDRCDHLTREKAVEVLTARRMER